MLSGTGVTPTDRYFGYNAANQLIAEGDSLDGNGDVIADYTYEYDANGNLRFKKDITPTTLETYTWDRANRLLAAPGSTSYKYDGTGTRIQQTVSSVVTNYLLDTQPGLAVVLQQTTSGNVDRFIHGPRGIHAQQDNSGDWFYPVQDALGSVRGVVDAVSAVQGMRHYEPYGTPFGAQGSLGMPFGFTGEQTDGNELLYLRARYLSPGLGVFASLDPFEGTAQRPMSLNGYSWVEGNVVNMVDPSGMQAECGDDILCLLDIENTITNPNEAISLEFCQSQPDLCRSNIINGDVILGNLDLVNWCNGAQCLEFNSQGRSRVGENRQNLLAEGCFRSNLIPKLVEAGLCPVAGVIGWVAGLALYNISHGRDWRTGMTTEAFISNAVYGATICALNIALTSTIPTRFPGRFLGEYEYRNAHWLTGLELRACLLNPV